MYFKSENEMAILFKKFFNKNFKTTNIDYKEECKKLFGVPDVVVVEKNENYIKHIVAFELKLNKWQKALTQAFKYTSFANQSFVVIDEYHITPVLKHIEKFIHFNIGIASFNKHKDFKIYFYPKIKKPFSDEYYAAFNGIFIEQQGHSALDETLKSFLSSTSITEGKSKKSTCNSFINRNKFKRFLRRDKFEFLLNGEVIVKNNSRFLHSLIKFNLMS